MLHILTWAIGGAFLGWLANLLFAIPRRSFQAFFNVLMGGLGAVGAGAILAPLLGVRETLSVGFNVPGLITALLGAVIILTNVNVARYLRRR